MKQPAQQKKPPTAPQINAFYHFLSVSPLFLPFELDSGFMNAFQFLLSGGNVFMEPKSSGSFGVTRAGRGKRKKTTVWSTTAPIKSSTVFRKSSGSAQPCGSITRLVRADYFLSRSQRFLTDLTFHAQKDNTHTHPPTRPTRGGSGVTSWKLNPGNLRRSGSLCFRLCLPLTAPARAAER